MTAQRSCASCWLLMAIKAAEEDKALGSPNWWRRSFTRTGSSFQMLQGELTVEASIAHLRRLPA
jgi:hypothetical protein